MAFRPGAMHRAGGRRRGADDARRRPVVNSAGLAAPAVAGRIEGLDRRHIPKARFAKGNYFSVAGRQPFRRRSIRCRRRPCWACMTLDLAGQSSSAPIWSG